MLTAQQINDWTEGRLELPAAQIDLEDYCPCPECGTMNVPEGVLGRIKQYRCECGEVYYEK